MKKAVKKLFILAMTAMLALSFAGLLSTAAAGETTSAYGNIFSAVASTVYSGPTDQNNPINPRAETSTLFNPAQVIKSGYGKKEGGSGDNFGPSDSNYYCIQPLQYHHPTNCPTGLSQVKNTQLLKLKNIDFGSGNEGGNPLKLFTTVNKASTGNGIHVAANDIINTFTYKIYFFLDTLPSTLIGADNNMTAEAESAAISVITVPSLSGWGEAENSKIFVEQTKENITGTHDIYMAFYSKELVDLFYEDEAGDPPVQNGIKFANIAQSGNGTLLPVATGGGGIGNGMTAIEFGAVPSVRFATSEIDTETGARVHSTFTKNGNLISIQHDLAHLELDPNDEKLLNLEAWSNDLDDIHNESLMKKIHLLVNKKYTQNMAALGIEPKISAEQYYSLWDLKDLNEGADNDGDAYLWPKLIMQTGLTNQPGVFNLGAIQIPLWPCNEFKPEHISKIKLDAGIYYCDENGDKIDRTETREARIMAPEGGVWPDTWVSVVRPVSDIELRDFDFLQEYSVGAGVQEINLSGVKLTIEYEDGGLAEIPAVPEMLVFADTAAEGEGSFTVEFCGVRKQVPIQVADNGPGPQLSESDEEGFNISFDNAGGTGQQWYTFGSNVLFMKINLTGVNMAGVTLLDTGATGTGAKMSPVLNERLMRNIYFAVGEAYLQRIAGLNAARPEGTPEITAKLTPGEYYSLWDLAEITGNNGHQYLVRQLYQFPEAPHAAYSVVFDGNTGFELQPGLVTKIKFDKGLFLVDSNMKIIPQTMTNSVTVIGSLLGSGTFTGSSIIPVYRVLGSLTVNGFDSLAEYPVNVPGDALDLAGVTVSCAYEGGVKFDEEIPLTPEMITAVDASESGTGFFTVSYAGVSAQVPFIVVDKSVQTIAVDSPPVKTVYDLGESKNLDLNGLIVTASLNDGGTETVQITQGMLSGYDWLTVGIQTITVSYGGKTASFTVTVEDQNPEKNVEFTYASGTKGVDECPFAVGFTLNNLVPKYAFDILWHFEWGSNIAEKCWLQLVNIDSVGPYDDGWYRLDEVMSMKNYRKNPLIGQIAYHNGRRPFLSDSFYQAKYVDTSYTPGTYFTLDNVSEMKFENGFYWCDYWDNSGQFWGHGSDPAKYHMTPHGILRDDLYIRKNELGVAWVRVLKESEPGVTADDAITIKTMPLKLNYLVGEELDVSGIVITVHYEDGYTVDVVLDNDFRGIWNFNTPGTKQCYVSYNDLRVYFDVTVAEDSDPGPGPDDKPSGCKNSASAALATAGLLAAAFVSGLKRRGA